MNRIVGIEDNHAPKDELLRVEWNLGKRCNYNCSYCGNELHDKSSQHMSMDVFKNTIDQIKAGSDKTIKISFTGGEPFVNPNFVDMLKYAKENGVHRITYTIRKIRPRVNEERTGWHRPFEDGMLGYHPKFKEIARFEAEAPYYSKEELNWIKENT